jgi:hypothetical protein
MSTINRAKSEEAKAEAKPTPRKLLKLRKVKKLRNA